MHLKFIKIENHRSMDCNDLMELNSAHVGHIKIFRTYHLVVSIAQQTQKCPHWMGPTDEFTSLLPSKRVSSEFGLKPHFGSVYSAIMGIYTYNGAPKTGHRI